MDKTVVTLATARMVRHVTLLTDHVTAHRVTIVQTVGKVRHHILVKCVVI